MNNTNANYSSLWDIDQIYLQNEVDNITLAANASTPQTINLVGYSLTYPPVADAQFKISGDTVWRQFNDTSFSGFWVNVNMFLSPALTGLNLVYYNFNVTTGTIGVRYQVWTDMVTN
jgi:hypothetical protein